MSSTMRLAVAGGRRGGHFHDALAHLAGRVTLTAVCDPLETVRQQWAQEHPGIRTHADFDRLLASGDADALLLATPAGLHAKQAIAAMEAGLDVLSEVPACMTHDEAVALTDAVRRTGRTYMMAENYCYRRPQMMVRNMVERGAFGELTYAEGMYLHELGGLKFNADGTLTWRGEMQAHMSPSVYYPTHSLGPVSQWLGINRDDAFESVYALGYPGLSIANYARRRFGDNHPGASPQMWKRGDGAGCLIRTRRGRVIYLRVDTCSLRPHHMVTHELQGTLGCFCTNADAEKDPLIWLDGYSPGASPPRSENPDWRNGDPLRWQSLYELAEEFEHPRWREGGAKAATAGHGGGDFFVLEDFVLAAQGERENPIDVYDAVTWSSIIWLSGESVQTRQAVAAPDYRQAADAATAEVRA